MNSGHSHPPPLVPQCIPRPPQSSSTHRPHTGSLRSQRVAVWVTVEHVVGSTPGVQRPAPHASARALQRRSFPHA